MRLLVLGLTACVALLLLVTGAGAVRGRAHDGGTLVVLTPQPLTADPAQAWESSASLAIASAIGLRVPEASSAAAISRDRTSYTFKIKRGLRFSDGTKVSAANFAWTIKRNLQAKSVGARLLSDVKTVRVARNKLTVKLHAPSGDLATRLAQPEFSALPLRLPAGSPFPSGGPYYVDSALSHQIVLKRNRFYKGPRPHHVDEFDIRVNTSEGQSVAAIENGTADYLLGGVSDATANALAARYGVNGGSQLQIHPLLATGYVAFNTTRGPFTDFSLRQAANYAIDRPSMVRVLGRGALAAEPTDHIIPPGMPGFRGAGIYPLNGPDYSKARQIAGNRCGNVVLYTSNTSLGLAISNEFSYNLSQMGCTVDVRSFPVDVLLQKAGTKGEPFDAVISSWSADYPDPYDFLNILLNGDNIHADGNTNLAYFNNAKVNALLKKANRLTGPARYKAYGDLDIMITKNYAPWASFDNRNERDFVSKRVGGYLFQPANASADLNTLFIK